MKKPFTHILVTALLLMCYTLGFAQGQTVSADEQAKRAKEREVKTSEQYYYGEATANTQTEAMQFAKQHLVSQINELIIRTPELQYAEKVVLGDIEVSLENIVLPRGDKHRAIVYMPKSSLKAQYPQTNVVVETEPKEKLTEKPTAPTVADEPTVPKPDHSVKLVQAVKETPVEPAKEAPVEAKIAETPVPEVVEKPVATSPIAIEHDKAQAKSVPTAFTNTSDLLNAILNTSNTTDLANLFRTQKAKGKLAHGNNIQQMPKSSYILVFADDSKTIAAVYDKGMSTKRLNLLTNKNEDYMEQYSSNKKTWFQLYD